MESASPRQQADLGEVIVSSADIQRRIGQLAGEIGRSCGEGELTVIGVLEGALFFLADLVRQLPMPVHLLTVGVRSYRGRTPGEVEFTQHVQTDLAGANVLIVDDILDTGSTLEAVATDVRSHRPSDCRTCVLLRKQRTAPAAMQADFVGFDVPDVFVVGYGLDFDGRYRALPEIRALLPAREAIP